MKTTEFGDYSALWRELWVTKRYLMRHLGLSERTLYRMRKTERVRYVIYRGRCHYSKEDIQKALARNYSWQGRKSLRAYKAVRYTPLEDWVRSREVAARLGVSERRLHTLRSNGTMGYSRLGKVILYISGDAVMR